MKVTRPRGTEIYHTDWSRGRSIAGIEHDAFQTDDAFVRHLTATVRAGLGDRAGTCIDPRAQIVQGRASAS